MSSLQSKLEKCRARIAGHHYIDDPKHPKCGQPYNRNANKERGFRLLMRSAELHSQLLFILLERERSRGKEKK